MPAWISGDCGGANACSSAALQAYTLLLAAGYLTVINTVDTPVLLHAAQAFLITADTVVDGILPAFPHLFTQSGSAMSWRLMAAQSILCF